jgi:hypothetical protein
MIQFRKASLYSFIVFLALSAAVAIISLLSGAFGSLEVKVLLTTTVVALASICALCCSSYASQHKPWPGIIGIILAIISGLLLIMAVWLEIGNEFFWKPVAVLSIFTVAVAHLLALLTVRLTNYRWLRLTTAISIFLLASVLSFILLAEFELPTRFIAVLSIIVALETLVIPILGRIQQGDTRERLILTKRLDGNFQSANGKVYQVTELSDYTKP